MALLTKAMTIYFEVNPSKFLPMTGSKIKIDESTLLCSSRTHVGATTNLSKTLYSVLLYTMLINLYNIFNVKKNLGLALIYCKTVRA